MASTKKDYTVEGGGYAGFRLVDENGPLTGRHPTEEAAVASLEAARKAAAAKKNDDSSDES